jgi:predicted MPP superfamily phosphohydrolase
LPLIGPIFMPSLFSRHFDRGFFRAGRTLMYVGHGIGSQHPIRFGGCVPEITRLVLRAAGPETLATARKARRAAFQSSIGPR